MLLTFLIACSGSQPSSPDVVPALGSKHQQPREVPPVLVYRSDDGTAESATFSEWGAWDRLYSGVHRAHLRAGPSTDAEIVAELPLGVELIVREAVGEPVVLVGRLNRWYRVTLGAQDGYVFGSVLTPAAVEADLNDDGHTETVALTFTKDFQPQLRVLATDEDDDQPLQRIELSTAAAGGEASMSLFSPWDSGTKLIGVSVCAASRDCGYATASYSDALLAAVPTTAPPEAMSTGGGVLWIAGEESGLYIHNDRYQRASCDDCTPTRWEPAEAVVLLTLQLDDEPRGPDPRVACKSFATISEGPYSGLPLASCVAISPGKSGPDYLTAARFVIRGEGDWVYLKESSSNFNDFSYALKKRGISVAQDSETHLEGMASVPVIWAHAEGVVRFSSHLPRTYTEGNEDISREAVFSHPLLGAVFDVRRHTFQMPPDPDSFRFKFQAKLGQRFGDFVVKQPDGGVYVYEFFPTPEPADIKLAPEHAPLLGAMLEPPSKDERSRVASGSAYAFHYLDCSGTELSMNAWVDADMSALTQVASLEGQPIYAILDPDHPVVTAAVGEATAPVRQGLTLFWRDPFGVMVQLVHDSLQPPMLCEPIIYLYGDSDQETTVTLGESVRLYVSEPPAEDRGWRVLSTPTGHVIDLRSGQTYPHLFWEGESGDFSPPTAGEVVVGPQTRAFLAAALPRVGLQGREIDEFISMNAPILERQACNLLSFHTPEDIEAIAPLAVEPAPDTTIRVLLDRLPCPARPVPPIVYPTTPERGERVLVEWGMVHRRW